MSIQGHPPWAETLKLSISTDELERLGYGSDRREFSTSQLFQDKHIWLIDGAIIPVSEMTFYETNWKLNWFKNLAEIGGRQIDRNKREGATLPAEATAERERLLALPNAERVPSSILVAALHVHLQHLTSKED